MASSSFRRVLFAAAKLAALYALGVAILGAIVVVPFEGADWSIGPVTAALFALSFLLLAAARRAGFVALWALLIGLWVWAMADRSPLSANLPVPFLGWSVLALPLVVLEAAGLPASRIRILRWNVSAASLVLLGFITLIVGAVVYERIWEAKEIAFVVREGSIPTDVLFRTIAAVIWGPAPVVIALVEIVRVWKATGQMKTSAPTPA